MYSNKYYNMTTNIPEIILAGNAPKEYCKMLNTILSEEGLSEVCNITLYGADGQSETEALRDSIADYAEGRIQGVVCLPFKTPHIDVLKECVGNEGNAMFNVFVNNRMKMASVLGDVLSTDVKSGISASDIVERCKQVVDVLKRDFMIQSPRVAIIAMGNDSGETENEEQQDPVTIAIGELFKEGIFAFGPIEPETVFATNDGQEFDVLITMYDRQCLAAFEEIIGDATLTLIAGVEAPVVVLGSYEHVLPAVFLALDIDRRRKEYDTPFANPLPKLYKERKEDGDKARFAIKKKGFNPAEHRRENVNYTTIAKTQA